MQVPPLQINSRGEVFLVPIRMACSLCGGLFMLKVICCRSKIHIKLGALSFLWHLSWAGVVASWRAWALRRSRLDASDWMPRSLLLQSGS